ncbi:MAG: hypothetical protein P8Z79_24645 [Sedimentisphaerales bacterium]
MSSNSTKPREIRKFGLVAFAFFGLLWALGLWTHKPVPMYLFGALSLLGLGFILIPSQLAPVHTVWLESVHLIGRIVTTVILATAYYLAITPCAVIKRLFGGAPLPVKPDKKARSYWVTRTEPAQPKERFTKRY